MEKFYNLSAPQKSILLTEQFYNGTSINNIGGGIIVHEALDFKLFQEAIYNFVKYHDSFRIRLKQTSSGVKQYIEDFSEFDITFVDLKDEQEVADLDKKILYQPISIFEEPLFEFTIFRFPNNHGGYVIKMHHLISDAWTSGLLCRKIMHEYSNLLNHEDDGCSKKFSYINYLETEENYFASPKFEKDKLYWAEKFSTVPNAVSLPSMTDTSNEFSCEANRSSFVIPKKDMEQISEYCTNHCVSVFNFFMAILSTYLSKINDTEDFVIGTPILNRCNVNEKNTAGMFINIAPLRICLESKSTFVDLISSIAKDSMGLLRHQKYPYQNILEDLRKKDSSIPNLYNIVLSYQITRSNNECHIPYDTRWSFNGCTADDLDMHLYDMDEQGILNVAYDYKISKYTYIDIENMHKRLMHMIKQVLKSGDIELKDIEIVTPEEKHKILVEFNNTAADYPKDKTIVDLFEEQVEKTPDNVAVVFEDQKLTYRELNEKANQLAWYLKEKQSIKNEDFVSIILNRSIDLIIGILGVVKCGATYVAIDPDYPKDRINYMLENCHSKLVIVNNSTCNIPNQSINIINISEKSLINFPVFHNLNHIILPTNLLYIIYTSGSTGVPKGVSIEHKNVINLLTGLKKLIDFSSNKSMLSVATVCFDMFVLELWGSLLNGMRLVIANEQQQKMPSLLNKLCLQEKINILQTTPSRFNLLLDNNETECFCIFSDIIIGGETVPMDLLKKLEKFENLKIHHMYGPTETTVWSTGINNPSSNDITIGVPLLNTQVYILDKHYHLCPIYSVGEICISGDGVGKGYFNNKKLTQDKFIKHPFISNKILYRTGDLGYFKPNGEIVCLGRIDNQIKLRGFRVELDEIENTILQFPNVKKCIVCKKILDDKREILCAYYTEVSPISISNLRKELQKKLPTYMIPHFFIKLKTMPYTLNGKIDINSLPLPSLDTTKDRNIVEPRNEVDTLIINFLKKMLPLNSISIEDSLFELGSDSLTIINLCILLNNKLHIQLTVKDIFNHQTILNLSNYINTIQENTIIMNIKPAKPQDFYPASSAQKRIYYASKADHEKSILYNVPGALVFDTVPDIEKLKSCFEILFERHESLRTYFEIKNDDIVQKIAPNINFKLEIQTSTSTNTDYLLRQFIKPFNLAKAPLFRATLVIQNNESATLLIDMHHSISDGSSVSILLDELSKLYNGRTLQENPITYKDFSEWENSHFMSSQFKENEKFWFEHFQGELPVLNMPTTFARPTTQSFEGNSFHFQIDKKLNNRITKLSKELGITPYMFLLATYYILLYKYTNQEDIIIGTPVSGRDLPELSNLVGMFVNSLPMRAGIKSTLSFKTFLNNIKKMCLDSFEHQDYPLDFLVNKLNLKRNTNRSPLFDTMFIYQSMGAPMLHFKNIQTTYVEAKNTISKFDFSLEIIPNKENLNLRFEYCTKLFDEDFIEKLAHRYLKILSDVTNDVTTKISDIEMISEEEKTRILHDFNNTQFAYDKFENLQTIFEKNVENSPDKTAIIFEGKTISYQELNQKANQIANYLLANQIQPNDIVGIMLPRSIETIICMLGILKAGAGYLLIDSNLPKDRIEFMLNDCKAKLLISSPKLKKIDFENIYPFKVEDLTYYNTINPMIDISNDDAFAIIYTSGSTGTPKGIALKRQGVINLALIYQEILNTNCCDSFLSISSIAFDMFIVENFVPLLTGKTVVLTNEEEQKIPEYINQLILDYHIDFILTTPSRIELLLNDNKSNALKNLKVIQLGGESLTPTLCHKLKNHTKATLFNGYGPSEITACCSNKKIESANIVNIGKPNCNTQIYLLNQDLNLCPIGIEGEICISGDGVSKGYINHPEMTKKSFIKNPFGDGLLYRSGDIGKWNSAGEIEYIGRKDFQIKIRGLRVELSEIENKFLEISEIDNAAVVYKQDEDDNYLIGFFTSNSDIEPSYLRQEIAKSLPLYMVPKYIIKLDKMPITTNGKINKRELEKRKITKTEKRTYIAPENELQTLLCDTWNRFLHTQIGIDDNIFEVGVDSLIAIKFKTALLAHNINIPYANLFKYPTVRLLSENTHLHESTSNLGNFDYTKINKVLQKNNWETLKTAKITHNYKNNILLLGSNGFVGSHILYQFIKQDAGKAYCIIRDKNNKLAKDRLMDTLHFYFGNELDSLIDDRIILLRGDITKDNFGLNKEVFDEITKQISTVINSAAMVKHYGDIKKFKEVNIKLTEKLCEYCKNNHKKLLHTSTMSVSESSNMDATYVASKKYEGTPFAENNLYIGQILDNSYTSTKFEAERIILSYLADGLNAKIIRLGNITNRSSDGTFQINPDENAFANRLKSFIRLKNIPDYLQALPLEFTPVDLCAKAIVYILQNTIKDFSIYHLYNNHSIYLKDFVSILNENKIPLNFVESKKFKSIIKKMLEDSELQNELSGVINDLSEDYDLIYERDVDLNCDLTQFFLQRFGFEWIKIDDNYIEKYIAYMKKIDFFKEEQ